MKKIIINKNNSVIDDTWMTFKKVRIIIEDSENNYIISNLGGKIIFPGGKQKNGESDIDTIKREVKEETGILLDEEIKKVLEIDTYYEDFYDYRSDSIKPRYTKTIYFYANTDKEVDKEGASLSDGEKKLGLNAFKLSREELINCLNQDHSDIINGKFFDEENKIIINEILAKSNH